MPQERLFGTVSSLDIVERQHGRTPASLRCP
jgi:hypothetical protein